MRKGKPKLLFFLLGCAAIQPLARVTLAVLNSEAVPFQPVQTLSLIGVLLVITFVLSLNGWVTRFEALQKRRRKRKTSRDIAVQGAAALPSAGTVSLVNTDYSDKRLNGKVMAGWDLSGANFAWAQMNDTVLSKAVMIGTRLTKAKLNDAVLTDTILVGAHLNGADLARANLRGANLTDAAIVGANLNGTNFSKAKLVNADLSNALLDGTNFSDADLKGANLTGATVSGAIFTRAKFNRRTILPDGSAWRANAKIVTPLAVRPSSRGTSRATRSRRAQ